MRAARPRAGSAQVLCRFCSGTTKPLFRNQSADKLAQRWPIALFASRFLPRLVADSAATQVLHRQLFPKSTSLQQACAPMPFERFLRPPEAVSPLPPSAPPPANRNDLARSPLAIHAPTRRRSGANLFDRPLAVGFVNADRAACTDAIRVQENHDVANDLLLGPGVLDALPAHRTNPFHILEPARFILDNIENLLAKFLNQFFGIDRADAPHHSAAQIFFDPFPGCRRGTLEQVRAELHPELTVPHPLSFGCQPLTRSRRR